MATITINLFVYVIILFVGEWLANSFIFNRIKDYFHEDLSTEIETTNDTNKTTKPLIHFGRNISISAVKGILERGLILAGLLLNMSQVLTLFGALKIGTRLDKSKTEISNNYFLVGNFVSAFLTLIYYYFFKHFSTCLIVFFANAKLNICVGFC